MNQRIKKFFSYYKPYIGLFALDISCALVVSATTLTIPLCIRSITKLSFETHSPDIVQHIWIMAALMLTLLALHIVCHAFVDYKGHMMGAMMERDMRNELFDHYQKLSFTFYDNHRVGQLMTRISNDTFDLAELYHHGPEDIVISLLNCIGASIILMNINIELALVTALFLIIMILHGVYFSKKMHKALRRSKDRIGDINAQVEDTLAGIRVVQSFTNEELEQKKFTHENSRFVESRREGYKSETCFYDGLLTFTQLMTITVVIFGALNIVKGSLDVADLLTFLLYLAILTEPIQRLGNFTRLYQEGIAGFRRVMEFLELQPDIQDAPSAHHCAHVQGNIEFKNVCFRYREHHDHILKNISLTVRAGEYVALVGPSGAGKTTLCSLIPRFYEVSDGEILLDGTNIHTLTLNSLRASIGLVQQDVYLFAGTVFDNIRYGRLTASDAEVIAAAKQAHAHEFIMALPNGYATDIGQRGVKLSGGQKQRLGIARVFLKNPPILIFDEATSSLDNESEKAVQDSLERLIQNRTTIVIAHRLSTIRNAERILVLTEKGIVEEGTHDELVRLKGTYANLYHMQLIIQDSDDI